MPTERSARRRSARPLRSRHEGHRGQGIGDLVDRFRAKAVEDGATPESFVFQQKRAPGRPLWDSGVRDALHQAAEAEGCDFEGLGPHSFRRANITWRQQVGGVAVMAAAGVVGDVGHDQRFFMFALAGPWPAESRRTSSSP